MATFGVCLANRSHRTYGRVWFGSVQLWLGVERVERPRFPVRQFLRRKVSWTSVHSGTVPVGFDSCQWRMVPIAPLLVSVPGKSLAVPTVRVSGSCSVPGPSWLELQCIGIVKSRGTTSQSSIKLIFPGFGLGALKGTELRWQGQPKTQIFAENPQIFADSPLHLEIHACGGRRKPQKTEDFRRKPQATADWAPSARRIDHLFCPVDRPVVSWAGVSWTLTSAKAAFTKAPEHEHGGPAVRVQIENARVWGGDHYMRQSCTLKTINSLN